MFSKHLVCVVVLVLLGGAVGASPVAVRFNGGFDDFATSIATDAMGNAYVGGYVESTSRKFEFAVLKYNVQGGLQWTAKYLNSEHGVDAGAVSAIALDAAGNVYAVGYVYKQLTLFTYNMDWLVVSYSPDGVERWSHRINGTADDRDTAGGVVVDTAGNVYVTGMIADAEQGGQGGWTLVKYSPTGTPLWRRTDMRVDGTRDTLGFLQIDSAGNLIGTGTNTSVQAGVQHSVVTTKIDSNGAVLWRRLFTDTPVSDETVEGLDVDAAGNVYVTGATVASTNPELAHVPITLKYDTAGNLRFALRGDGAGGSSVIVDETGDVIVSGTSFREGGNVGLAATAKYDSSGNRKWMTANVAGKLAVDTAGNIYSFSSVQLFTADHSDLQTTKLSSNGIPQWEHRYDGKLTTTNASADWPVASAIDPFDNLIVLANAQDGIQDDIVTVRYAANVTPQQPPTTVSAPTGLTTAAQANRVLLSWVDNADNESAFRIERCAGKNCANFALLAQTVANLTSYADTSVSARTTYRYRVRATRDTVVSAYSNIVTVTTPRR